MSRILFCITFSFIALFLAPDVSYALQGPGTPLPEGTPINLVLVEEIHSQRNLEGDEIIFEVRDDVVVGGQTFLVAGTPVIGVVTIAKSSQSWGRRGSVSIEINSLYPLYSDPIALTGQAIDVGDIQTPESVGAVIVLGGITVFGLLAGGAISGEAAVIQSGTELTVFSMGDGEVSNESVASKRSMVADWYEERVVSAFLNYTWDNYPTISQTMENMGYSVDRSDITVQELDDFVWQVEVRITSDTTALFTFRPFEEVRLGKFVTLKAENETGQIIFDAVMAQEQSSDSDDDDFDFDIHF